MLRVQPVFAFILLLAVEGCIPAVTNRISAQPIVPSRIVAVPPAVLVGTLDFSGNFEPEHDPSAMITADVMPSLIEIMNANRSRVASPKDLDLCGSRCLRLIEWAVIASLEIAEQRAQIRNFDAHSVSDWTFRGGLSAARRAFQSDYMLLTVFKQAHETRGRKISSVLSGSFTVGNR